MNNEKRVLKPRDICDLIKTCRENGVSKLQFGDLLIEFPPQWDRSHTSPNGWSVPVDTTTLPDTEISEAQFEETKKEDLERKELELKEDQLAEMMLADPLSYEKLMASGELEDAS